MEHPTIFLSRLGKFALIPIGLLLLLAAAWSVWSTKTWLARTLEVEGVVIEMVRMRDSDDKGYLFSPIVRFETADGATHEFQSGLRTYHPLTAPARSFRSSMIRRCRARPLSEACCRFG